MATLAQVGRRQTPGKRNTLKDCRPAPCAQHYRGADSTVSTGSASPQVVVLCPLNTQSLNKTKQPDCVIPCWPGTQKSPAPAFRGIRCVCNTLVWVLYSDPLLSGEPRLRLQSQVSMAAVTSVACLAATVIAQPQGQTPSLLLLGGGEAGGFGCVYVTGRAWCQQRHSLRSLR